MPLTTCGVNETLHSAPFRAVPGYLTTYLRSPFETQTVIFFSPFPPTTSRMYVWSTCFSLPPPPFQAVPIYLVMWKGRPNATPLVCAVLASKNLPTSHTVYHDRSIHISTKSDAMISPLHPSSLSLYSSIYDACPHPPLYPSRLFLTPIPLRSTAVCPVPHGVGVAIPRVLSSGTPTTNAQRHHREHTQ